MDKKRLFLAVILIITMFIVAGCQDSNIAGEAISADSSLDSGIDEEGVKDISLDSEIDFGEDLKEPINLTNITDESDTSTSIVKDSDVPTPTIGVPIIEVPVLEDPEIPISIIEEPIIELGNMGCNSTITKSVKLNNDITGCTNDKIITIKAADITFDCNGKTISGIGLDAIYVNANNVTIKNCKISLTGSKSSGNAIHFDNSDGGKIFNNVVSVPINALSISNGKNFDIGGNSFTALTSALYLDKVTDSEIYDNTLTAVKDNALVIHGASYNNSFDNNEITSVGGNIITDTSDGKNNLVYGNNYGKLTLNDASSLTMPGPGTISLGSSLNSKKVIEITPNNIYVDTQSYSILGREKVSLLFNSIDLDGEIYLEKNGESCKEDYSNFQDLGRNKYSLDVLLTTGAFSLNGDESITFSPEEPQIGVVPVPSSQRINLEWVEGKKSQDLVLQEGSTLNYEVLAKVVSDKNTEGIEILYSLNEYSASRNDVNNFYLNDNGKSAVLESNGALAAGVYELQLIAEIDKNTISSDSDVEFGKPLVEDISITVEEKKIESNLVIDTPGAHVLTEDLICNEGFAFVIAGDNVELNCQGNKIISDSIAVYAENVANAKVINCDIVAGRNGGPGIVFNNVNGGLIANNNIETSEYAIYLDQGTNNVVLKNNVLTANKACIISDVSGSSNTNTIILENDYGIFKTQSSDLSIPESGTIGITDMATTTAVDNFVDLIFEFFNGGSDSKDFSSTFIEGSYSVLINDNFIALNLDDYSSLAAFPAELTLKDPSLPDGRSFPMVDGAECSEGSCSDFKIIDDTDYKFEVSDFAVFNMGSEPGNEVPLHWTIEPLNFEIDYGETFRYTVQADGPSDIFYFIEELGNDTPTNASKEANAAEEVSENFMINSVTGEITTMVDPLAVGSYELRITAKSKESGELITGDMLVAVTKQIPLSWVTAPKNRDIDYGIPFEYTFEATGPDEIRYSLIEFTKEDEVDSDDKGLPDKNLTNTNPANFEIDSLTGTVTSILPLKAETDYKLLISADSESTGEYIDGTMIVHVNVNQGKYACGTVIKTPYQLVVLEEDIINCKGGEIMSITADHVTLDCQGHTLQGLGGNGITIAKSSNVEVKNCNINLDDGYVALFLDGVSNTLIEGNTIGTNANTGANTDADTNDNTRTNTGTNSNANTNSDSQGIYIERGSSNTIVNNDIDVGGSGLVLSYTSDNLISDNNINTESSSTISLIEAESNQFYNNQVNAEGDTALELINSDYNTIENNQISASEYTLWFTSSRGNTLMNNELIAANSNIVYTASTSSVNNDGTNTLIYENANGFVRWINELNIPESGVLALGKSIIIANNNIEVLSDLFPSLNTNAELTFSNIKLSSPSSLELPIIPLRNGFNCEEYCSNFEMIDQSTYSFDVSGFTDYSLGFDSPMPIIYWDPEPENQLALGGATFEYDVNAVSVGVDKLIYKFDEENSIFIINEDTGLIKSVGPLPKGEQVFPLTIIVKDYDKVAEPITATITVTIVSKIYLEWKISPMDYTILRDDSFEHQVIAIGAEEVIYSLDEILVGGGTPLPNHFAINPETGVISNIRPLDEIAEYSLIITAEDAEGVVNSITETMNVKVIIDALEWYIFPEEELEFVEYENIEVQVRAIGNEFITYSIDDVSGYFDIDSSTGLIYNNEFVPEGYYILNVIANGLSTTFSDSLSGTLSIQVLPYIPPELSWIESYEPVNQYIYENEGISYQVQAEGVAQVSYTVSDRRRFDITSDGWITNTINPLPIGNYPLIVTATDVEGIAEDLVEETLISVVGLEDLIWTEGYSPIDGEIFEGEIFTLAVQAQGEGADDIVYTIDDLNNFETTLTDYPEVGEVLLISSNNTLVPGEYPLVITASSESLNKDISAELVLAVLQNGLEWNITPETPHEITYGEDLVGLFVQASGQGDITYSLEFNLNEFEIDSITGVIINVQPLVNPSYSLTITAETNAIGADPITFDLEIDVIPYEIYWANLPFQENIVVGNYLSYVVAATGSSSISYELQNMDCDIPEGSPTPQFILTDPSSGLIESIDTLDYHGLNCYLDVIASDDMGVAADIEETLVVHVYDPESTYWDLLPLDGTYTYAGEISIPLEATNMYEETISYGLSDNVNFIIQTVENESQVNIVNNGLLEPGLYPLIVTATAGMSSIDANIFIEVVMTQLYNNELSTNFSNVADISAVTNLTLAIPGSGILFYPGIIDLTGVNIDESVTIGNNLIGVDSVNAPVLNVTAILRLLGLNLNNPRLLRNGEICSGDICSVVEEYNNGALLFNVTHFTTYTSEDYCGNDVCDNGETKSSCSNDCKSSSGGSSSHRSRNVVISVNDSCEPNWYCKSWIPSVCQETGRQLRTCTDLNSCADASDKPETFRSCQYIATSDETISFQIETPPLVSVPTRTRIPPITQDVEVNTRNWLRVSLYILLILIVSGLIVLSVFFYFRWRKNKGKSGFKEWIVNLYNNVYGRIFKKGKSPSGTSSSVSGGTNKVNQNTPVNTQKIKQYLVNALAQGSGLKEVRDKLVSVGWNKELVDNVIINFKKENK